VSASINANGRRDECVLEERLDAVGALGRGTASFTNS
jgi:hypothetical protein